MARKSSAFPSGIKCPRRTDYRSDKFPEDSARDLLPTSFPRRRAHSSRRRVPCSTRTRPGPAGRGPRPDAQAGDDHRGLFAVAHDHGRANFRRRQMGRVWTRLHQCGDHRHQAGLAYPQSRQQSGRRDSRRQQSAVLCGFAVGGVSSRSCGDGSRRWTRSRRRGCSRTNDTDADPFDARRACPCHPGTSSDPGTHGCSRYDHGSRTWRIGSGSDASY